MDPPMVVGGLMDSPVGAVHGEKKFSKGTRVSNALDSKI